MGLAISSLRARIVRESCENRAKVWANDSRKPLQRNGLRGFLSCENRAKIVRKSCGATGAACPEPQKHNGCVQFLSCENRANRLLYLFPGRLLGGLFCCQRAGGMRIRLPCLRFLVGPCRRGSRAGGRCPVGGRG